MTQGTPPLAARPVGPARITTLAFKMEGQPRAAVILKGTFLVVQDGLAVLATPDPLVLSDEHIERDPARSVLATSDLVPYRPRADVLLCGRARAPMGEPAPWIGVRLMVARGSEVCIDKRLLVRGPPDPRGPDKAPLPFYNALLTYELAGGGDENPARARDGGEWPRVLDQWHRAFPLGFGPLGRLWPARRRLLPDARPLDEPVPDFPRAFPWSYFNVAPADQRIDHLRGDEWIGFEGFHSQIPRVQTYLPRARAVARVYGPTPALDKGVDVTFQADTLIVNADRMRISVVWRGCFAMSESLDPATLLVLGGVEHSGHHIELPTSYEAATRVQGWVASTADAEDEAADTGEPVSSRAPRSTPFVRPAAGTSESGGEEPPPSTVDFSEDLAAVARSAAALPFPWPASGSPSPHEHSVVATPFAGLALMGNQRSGSPPPAEAESADDLLPEGPIGTFGPRRDAPPPPSPGAVPAPPPLLGAPTAPLPAADEPAEPPAAPEKTLGAFFLAAMARRGALPPRRDRRLLS